MQTKIDEILENTTDLVKTEYVKDEYQLLKKEQLENKTFIVFSYDTIKAQPMDYFNFKCLDEKSKTTFCFNGSGLLVAMLENNELPTRVKLVQKENPKGKFSKYYWAFEKP
jgi:Cft2 family RNA processing exonuclease